jgi:hypothetical protein
VHIEIGEAQTLKFFLEMCNNLKKQTNILQVLNRYVAYIHTQVNLTGKSMCICSQY